MADISLSFLGHIERGTRKLSVETLCRLAKALHCSFDALLGHTGGNPKIKYSEILRLIADEYEQIGK